MRLMKLAAVGLAAALALTACGQGSATKQAAAPAGKSVVRESIDPDREVTIEFLAVPASVGSFDFRPTVASMRIHPGKLYDTLFHARNLTQNASVAQAVPSISPSPTAKYFHKTECFCFSPQKFAAGEGRDL